MSSNEFYGPKKFKYTLQYVMQVHECFWDNCNYGSMAKCNLVIEQKHVSAVVNLKFNAVSNTLLGKKIMRAAHSGLRWII